MSSSLFLQDRILKPCLNSQSVLLPGQRLRGAKQSYHIFFVPGNPGCIEYYHAFLPYLSSFLAKDGVSVVGYSLSGFVDAPREEQSVDGEPAAGHVNQILSLQEQIDLVETRLRTYLRIVLVAGAGYPARIILVGHSVGAYIALEILRRWREREEAHARDVMIPEDQGQILGFIGLWPTVTWIGKSPNGRKAAWIARVPYLPRIMARLARLLVLVTRRRLDGLVEYVTGFPPHAAKVTANFIRSKKGVEQALCMARDEMREITGDSWDSDTVWGTAEKSSMLPNPQLVFYFGTHDRWVADHTRDELIASRGGWNERRPWRAKMVIDQEDTPHSFCIRHSEIVAIQTAEFVRDMIQMDRGPR